MRDFMIPQAAERFNELLFLVEDLLKRIADTEDAELRRKRAQVRAEMVALQDTLGLSSIDTNYHR